jgi:hypothetical protein
MAMRPDDPRLTVAHSILLKLLDHKTVSVRTATSTTRRWTDWRRRRPV